MSKLADVMSQPGAKNVTTDVVTIPVSVSIVRAPRPEEYIPNLPAIVDVAHGSHGSAAAAAARAFLNALPNLRKID